ncbi:MAG: hypothetical protein KJZ96_04115 [Rhodocyclaceae bacterium]|jgi:hypothetical protein|nr:hypothetical protein [Rhodocyclaceae bacterium]MCL4757510.1 hypothetical protein [Rhodocyclaceae bacterium]
MLPRLGRTLGTIAALLVLATASPARAASPDANHDILRYEGGSLALNIDRGLCEITLRGEINPAMVRQLSHVLTGIEKSDCHRKRLTLHSSHGVVNSAITVGAMLRNRDFDTRIADGSVCQTPCALVFLSGRERLFATGSLPARIALHPIPPDRDFSANACRSELTRNQALTLSRYLRAMLPDRVATATFNKIGSADCRRIEMIGVQEAMALGIATGSWLQQARMQSY